MTGRACDAVHPGPADTMHGGVDRLDARLGVDPERKDLPLIRCVDFGGNRLDATPGFELGGHPPGTIQRGNLAGNSPVVGWHDLRSVAPVDLVSVVLRRVVRCRDHHAGLGTEGLYGVGEHGRRNHTVVDPDLESGVSEQPGGGLHEPRRVPAAVAADDHQGAGTVGPQQVPSKAPGDLAHQRQVHPIGSRAHRAADSCGPEAQLRAEAALQCGIVALLHHGADLARRLGVGVGGGPAGSAVAERGDVGHGASRAGAGTIAGDRQKGRRGIGLRAPAGLTARSAPRGRQRPRRRSLPRWVG